MLKCCGLVSKSFLGSQTLCPVDQQAWVPGHGLFLWVCWILLTVGQIRFVVLFCSFLCISAACLFGGIVIGMPNAPISVLAWAAGGISGVDFLVVVPLTLPL